jgi:predicted permease
VLVTAQLAISMVLVVSAGLLIHTLWQLSNVRLGVRAEKVTAASVVLGAHRYRSDADRYAFVQRLELALRRLPGAGAIAVADSLPPLVAQTGLMYSSIAVDGRRVAGNRPGGVVLHRRVTPGYFRALGIPLLRGRGFTDSNPHGAVLSDRLARRLFPDGDPVGHAIQPAGWRHSYTVVGVAGDVKNAGLTAEDGPEMYLPYSAGEPAPRFVSAAVESSAQPALVAKLLRDEIRLIDPSIPVTVETFADRIRTLNQRARFNAWLLSLFALIALALAATGVYAVLAFLVSQRLREIGLRIALGATPRRVVGWILSYAMRWTVAGILLGAAGAVAATRQIRSLLFQVSPADPWSFGAVAIVLVLAAMCAAYVPARRAARVDPAMTLRQE